MRGIRVGATLLSALMVLLGAYPASATTFTRLARYPEPLWDVISPADVVADGNGAMWVADTGHDRTVLVEPSGHEVVSIGWRGVQLGLGESVGLTVADDGSIWTSSGGDFVRRFTSSGDLLTTIELPQVTARYVRSAGIDLDGDGNVYVAETDAGAVYKYSSEGELLHTFGRADGVVRSGLGEFGGVVDVSVDASGCVWTTETYTDRIQKLDANGTPLLAFSPKNANGNVFEPRGVVPLPSGDVIVSGNGLLVRTDLSGTCLQTYFASGAAYSPGDVSVGSDGTIYWAERGTAAIRVFSAEGVLLDSYSRNEDYREQFNGPRAVAISQDGRIAVAQSDTILRYLRTDGSTIATMTLTASVSAAGDRGLAFDTFGRLWLADDMTNAVYAYSPEGTLEKAIGGFWNPTGIAFAPLGDFYVADAYNRVVKRFDSQATFVGAWRSVPASLVNYVYRQNLVVDSQNDVFVTQRYTLQTVPGISRYDAEGNLETFWQVNAAVSGTRAALGNLALDSHGNVWVCEPSSSRIQWFNRDGVPLGSWRGPADDPFVYPEGIAFDPEGNLWITDKSKNTLEAYRLDSIPDRAPVAVGDAYGTQQDAPLVVPAPGVLANDTDADGDPITAIKVSDPANGTVGLSATGGFLYTPAQGFVGVDTFTYRAYDGDAYSKTVTVSINVEDTLVVQIEGSDRYTTAVEASVRAYPTGLAPAGARTVVIATGENWPDALGGSSLAGALDGPVLLTRAGSLPVAVTDEIGRLGATRAIILGGTAAVSGDVEAALKTLLGNTAVERTAGSNRYATADAVAARVIDLAGAEYDGNAFVATGGDFPDALAAAPLAAANAWPLYLADPASGLSSGTNGAMAGVDTVLLLGGTAVVSESVETALETTYGADDVTRLSGADRYETAVKVATYGVDHAGLSWNRVAIATGVNFPDALAGGVLQGRVGSVMLLTKPDELNGYTRSALTVHQAGITTVTFFGGTGALPQVVRDEVAAALE